MEELARFASVTQRGGGSEPCLMKTKEEKTAELQALIDNAKAAFEPLWKMLCEMSVFDDGGKYAHVSFGLASSFSDAKTFHPDFMAFVGDGLHIRSSNVSAREVIEEIENHNPQTRQAKRIAALEAELSALKGGAK